MLESLICCNMTFASAYTHHTLKSKGHPEMERKREDVTGAGKRRGQGESEGQRLKRKIVQRQSRAAGEGDAETDRSIPVFASGPKPK